MQNHIYFTVISILKRRRMLRIPARKISSAISVKPCPTFISRLFISQQSRIAERDAFSQASAFSLFSRGTRNRGNWSAILFLFFFFFFVARHDLAHDLQEGIGMNRERWRGAENFSYGRFHGKNRIESRQRG